MILVLSPLVLGRHKIRFSYPNDDGDVETHEVEPHLIGANKTTDHVNLSAWFIPNVAQRLSGEKEGWKQYRLEFISELEDTGIRFVKPRPDYNPRDKRMKTIFCKV